MQYLKKHCKLNKICILLAFIQFAISFFTDQFIFLYVKWDFSNLKQTAKTIITYGCKVVFLLLLVVIWHFLFWFFTRADKRMVKHTLIYLVVNLMMLLATWPGIWRMDEFGILSNAVRLQPVFWQNYITSVFYIFSLMLIPCPSGVIIVQMTINSLIVGYILYKTEAYFYENNRNIGAWIYLLFVPFLLFPVLDSNLYPMRMSVYAFLELLLIFYMLESVKKKYAIGNVWKLAVLGAIVTVWRTEAIYYVIGIPIFYIACYHKEWKIKEILNANLIFIVIFGLLFIPQQLGSKLTSGNEYDLTSVMLPIVPLVEAADKDAGNEALLERIDQVLSVDVLLEGAREGKSGISLFWSKPEELKRVYSEAEYMDFKKAYYELIIKYPLIFLEERWQSFVTSDGLLENTTELFSKDGVPNYEVFAEYHLSNPINDTLRSSVIKTLELRSQEDYQIKRTGYGVVYSAIPAIMVMMLGCIVLLVKKEYLNCLILALPLAKVPLIFLTAPSRLFMYYYSAYLIGNTLFVFSLLIGVVKLMEAVRRKESIQ